MSNIALIPHVDQFCKYVMENDKHVPDRFVRPVTDAVRVEVDILVSGFGFPLGYVVMMDYDFLMKKSIRGEGKEPQPLGGVMVIVLCNP